MKDNTLKKALKELSIKYKEKLEAQAKIEKTYATGKFSKSFKINTSNNGFKITSNVPYAKNVNEGSPKGYGAKLGNILVWAKKKRLRPYRKLPWGTTKFVKLTDKSWLSMGIAIQKGIKKNGTIKRYKYEGSKIFDKVFDIMEKKIGTEIGSAYSQDLKNELRSIVDKSNNKRKK